MLVVISMGYQTQGDPFYFISSSTREVLHDKNFKHIVIFKGICEVGLKWGENAHYPFEF